MAFGKTTETISPTDLGRIIPGIAGMTDGYPVAVEILSMHFHGQREDQTRWDAALIDCGRLLLRSYPFDRLNQTTEYELATIAKVCLRDNDAAEDAGLVCRRLVEHHTEQLISRFQLDGLVEALFTFHPQVALDCFLGGVQDEWRHREILSIDLEARNPLCKVPTQVFL